MIEWLKQHPEAIWWIGSVSLATLVIALVAVPFLISRMRADYFLDSEKVHPERLANKHPAWRIALLSLRNLIGGLLVILGILLSVPGIPGQGLLTIFAGLMLMHFPGKRSLELRLIRFRPVGKAVDWIRRKGNQEPLRLPEAPSL